MKAKFLHASATLAIVAVCVLLLAQAPTVYAANYCMHMSGTGNWSVPGTWTNCNSATPGTGDWAFILGGTVTVDSAVSGVDTVVVDGGTLSLSNSLSVNTLTFNSGAFSDLGTNTLTVLNQLNVNGGTFQSPNGTSTIKTLSIASGATFTAGGAATITSLTNEGTFNGNGKNVTVSGSVSNSGTFNAGSGTIDLKGDLTNSGTFNAGTGTVKFSHASANQTIGGTSAITFNNLTIDKAAGKVTLGNDATVNGTLALTTGDLDTGSSTLTMGDGAATTGNYDVIGTVKHTNPTAGAKSYGSQFTTLNFSSAVTGDVTVTLVKSAAAGLTGTVSRRYTLNVPSGTADVRLHYRDSEIPGGVTETDLQLWRYNGTAGKWILQVVDSRSNSGTDDNYLQKNGVSAFSDWGIATGGSPTAVTLSNFSGKSGEPQNWLPIGLGGVGLLVLGALAFVFAKQRQASE